MSKQKLRKSFSKLGSQDTGETDQVCRGILEHVRLVSKTLQAEHPQALIVFSQSQSWRIWEGKMEWFHCGGVCWPSTTHRTFPEFRQARMTGSIVPCIFLFRSSSLAHQILLPRLHHKPESHWAVLTSGPCICPTICLTASAPHHWETTKHSQIPKLKFTLHSPNLTLLLLLCPLSVFGF